MYPQTQQNVLQFKKIDNNAIIPNRAHHNDAGLDIHSSIDCYIPARSQTLVKTGIQMKLPKNTYGRIAPRSGLALKHKLDIMAGVIDEGYRGEICVIMFNHSDVDYNVKIGDKIAQMVIEYVCYPQIQEVKDIEDDIYDFGKDEKRQSNGFGSTGK